MIFLWQATETFLGVPEIRTEVTAWWRCCDDRCVDAESGGFKNPGNHKDFLKAFCFRQTNTTKEKPYSRVFFKQEIHLPWIFPFHLPIPKDT